MAPSQGQKSIPVLRQRVHLEVPDKVLASETLAHLLMQRIEGLLPAETACCFLNSCHHRSCPMHEAKAEYGFLAYTLHGLLAKEQSF